MKTLRTSLTALFCIATLCAGSAWTQVDSLPPAAPPADSSAAMATRANIARAQFTSDVVDREPVDDVETLDTASDHVYFFTEVVGLAGRTVVHRWVHDGETVAEVPIRIGGQRWRVYSSKKLDATSTGTWTVRVLDERGTVIAERTLQYEPATATTSSTANAQADTLR